MVKRETMRSFPSLTSRSKRKTSKIKMTDMKPILLKLKKIFPAGPFLIFAALLAGGCTTVKTTNPVRTATEQLLLSTAVDHALKSAKLLILRTGRFFWIRHTSTVMTSYTLSARSATS